MQSFQEKCQDRLKRILDSAIGANQSFEMLMQLREAQISQNEIVNLSPAFYATVIRNCIQSLFIETNKMFDPSENAEGIRSLLLKTQSNLQQISIKGAIECNEFDKLTAMEAKTVCYASIEQLITTSLERIDSHSKQLLHLKAQRDKYYAHFDKGIVLDYFFEKFKVSIADLEELLLLNVNLCNALNMAFNKKTTVPVACNYDDFKNTLFYVQKGFQQSDSELPD